MLRLVSVAAVVVELKLMLCKSSSRSSSHGSIAVCDAVVSFRERERGGRFEVAGRMRRVGSLEKRGVGCWAGKVGLGLHRAP